MTNATTPLNDAWRRPLAALGWPPSTLTYIAAARHLHGPGYLAARFPGVVAVLRTGPSHPAAAKAQSILRQLAMGSPWDADAANAAQQAVADRLRLQGWPCPTAYPAAHAAAAAAWLASVDAFLARDLDGVRREARALAAALDAECLGPVASATGDEGRAWEWPVSDITTSTSDEPPKVDASAAAVAGVAARMPPPPQPQPQPLAHRRTAPPSLWGERGA